MKLKARDFFFLLGVASIVWMLLTFPFSWLEVRKGLLRAGMWIPVIIGLWLPVYALNTWAWRTILGTKRGKKPSFWRMYQLIVTGFALNYVTPVGLLGGEPYRIMELKSEVGTVRASSSTILHSMMHIFSHFCFWCFSIALFLALYFSRLNEVLIVVLMSGGVFCLVGIGFFLLSYRHGLAVRVLRWASHLPFIGRRVKNFMQVNGEKIAMVDEEICNLHSHRPLAFYGSLILEFVARMLSCVEIFLILRIMDAQVSYWDAVLIHAFSSLLSNLVFFIPMQLGAREGSMAMCTSALRIGASQGVFLGLIIRLREIVWIVLGIAAMRIIASPSSGSGK